MTFSPQKRYKASYKRKCKKKTFTGNSIQEIPTQNIKNSKQTLIEKCVYNKKGYCSLGDKDCVPYSLKCKWNKKSFPNSISYYATDYHKSESNKRGTRIRYDVYADERYGSNKVITTLSNNNVIELYVFKGFLKVDSSKTIDYEILVKDFNTNRNCKILVAYNTLTKRYYISETQLKYWHKRNFFPKIPLNLCDEGSVPMVTSGFNEFSKLTLYGYAVGVNGLNEKQRHEILEYVINNKIMRGYEIIKHLQGLIFLRNEQYNKNFSAAINDWENDIMFIEKYITTKQK